MIGHEPVVFQGTNTDMKWSVHRLQHCKFLYKLCHKYNFFIKVVHIMKIVKDSNNNCFLPSCILSISVVSSFFLL